MTRRATPTAAILALGLAILATSVGGPSLGAAAEEPEGASAEAPAVDQLVSSVRGRDIRLARARVATRWTRVADPTGDQVLGDGTLSADAPVVSDVVATSLTAADTVAKFVNNWRNDYPFGTAETYSGAQADWSRGDAALFVVLDMAAKLDREVDTDVQLIVAWDGRSVSVGGDEPNPYHGAQVASISGLFDGAWLSGTFDLDGWNAGDPLPGYNAPARDIGRYDRQRGAIVHVARRPRAATAARLALRSNGAHGEAFDEILSPSGTPWFGLDDPTWGLDVRGAATPLACRSLETFSSDTDPLGLSDPTATIIRQAVGWVDDPDVARAHLDLLAALGETVPVTISPVDPDAEPIEVEARVHVAPALGAAIFTMEVPAGQWTFMAAEGMDVATPSGELLIDHRPLTGRGGVLTGPGLDGAVIGDTSCGRWQVPPACDLIDGEVELLLGLQAGDLAETDVRTADGRRLCAGLDEATGEPKFVVGIGTDHFDSQRFDAAVEALECPVSETLIGAEAVLIDCRELGYVSFLARALPPSAAGVDPDGGLSWSIDVVTGGGDISDEQLADLGRTIWERAAPSIGTGADVSASLDEADAPGDAGDEVPADVDDEGAPEGAPPADEG